MFLAQYGAGDVSNPLRRRTNSSSNDTSSKYARYDDGSRRRDVCICLSNFRNMSHAALIPLIEFVHFSKQSEDDDLKVYREKVEDQKRLREKYIQEKEEQRLKNQMQSFIQNNIRGMLKVETAMSSASHD